MTVVNAASAAHVNAKLKRAIAVVERTPVAAMQLAFAETAAVVAAANEQTS